MDKVKVKLVNLPDEPGCYLMKDRYGKIIYVGKAKNLKNRVNSYFTGAHNYKVTKMVSLIDDFDYIVTATEKESLILELNLIKKHQPRFNIIFMDDKVYPYIKITSDEWPRLVISRKREKDKGARFFGPYPDSSAARKMISVLGKIYPIRKCTTMPKEVCLYYHLGQCLGMCQYDVDKDEYQEMIEDIARVLRGNTDELLKDYLSRQQEAVEALHFERAGEIQEIIDSLKHISDRQQVQINTKDNIDIFNYYVKDGYLSIVTIQLRDGKILNKKPHLAPLYEDVEDAVISYINQYYLTEPLVPEIIIPKAIDLQMFTDEVEERIFVPQRGRKVRFTEMAYNNAVEELDMKFNMMNTLPEKIAKATQQLDELLDHTVYRVEMFDISHTGGKNNVAGMVVFDEGLPNKNEYRMYKLEEDLSDYHSMKEVLYRRYFKLLSENLQMPDLVIVDGGQAQLTAAKEILSSLHVDIKIVGLVKDDFHNTSSLLNTDGTLIEIDKESELFFFLSRMQDEVHRFAINYHRRLRTKSQTRSILDDIDGVGESRKKKLLKHFKSIKSIKEATKEELTEVVPEAVADNIIDFFKE